MTVSRGAHRTTVLLLGVVGFLTLGACGDGPEEEAVSAIDRSIFVDTYVDLRVAALRTEGRVAPARKEAILEEHGVTEEDLLEFAEVHGRDAAFMRDVWDEVEAKLDSARAAGPGTGDGVDPREERDATRREAA